MGMCAVVLDGWLHRDSWRHCLSKCLNCHRQFSVSEMVGLTVYQSVLTAVRQFSVAETVGINVYQSFF